MNIKDLAIAELGVVLYASIVTGVGYGSMWVLTGAPFSVFWFVIVVAVLTIATNLVFFYARANRPELIAAAEQFN